MTSIIPSFAAPTPAGPMSLGASIAPATATSATDASSSAPTTAAALGAAFAGVFAKTLKEKTDDATATASPTATALDDATPAVERAESGTTASLAGALPGRTAATLSAGGRNATDALRDLVARVAGEPFADANGGVAQPATSLPAAPTGAGSTPNATDASKHESATKASTDDATPVPSAAASALDAARTLALSDPSIVVRDLAALQPAFREKVERVMERMKTEYGRDVTVTETWRSQARQDFLVQQGRTRPGPVVTWTRQSHHADGAAVDLVVAGKPGDATGYQQLARVASEEGLQTLGPRDPGHVQLPGDRALRDIAKVATISEIHVASAPPRAIASMRNGTAGAALPPNAVAPVATVAAVARVADVARVAQVASTDGPRTRPGDQSEAAPRPKGADARPSATAKDAVASLTAPVTGAPTHTTLAAGQVAGAERTDIASRIDQVLALQDARDAQPASQMLLRIDNADGGEDRIRVGVRGSSVGATMDMHDPATASQMNDRIQELNAALEARGLSADAVHVRAASVAGTSAASELSRGVFASADPAALRSGTLFAEPPASGSRTRDDAQGQRNPHDPSRYRSRREQKGDTP